MIKDLVSPRYTQKVLAIRNLYFLYMYVTDLNHYKFRASSAAERVSALIRVSYINILTLKMLNLPVSSSVNIMDILQIMCSFVLCYQSANVSYHF